MVKAPSVKTVEIAPIKTALVTGGNVQLDAVTRIFNGDPRTGVPINWTSDNPRVASVDAAGIVTGVGPGKANITATSGAATATTTISVVKNVLRSCERLPAELPFTWGAQPHNGLIYFNDVNSGLWIVKLGEKIDKGSTTAPGQ